MVKTPMSTVENEEFVCRKCKFEFWWKLYVPLAPKSHLQVKNLILMLKRQTIELQIQNTVLKLQNKDLGIETSLLKMRIS